MHDASPLSALLIYHMSGADISSTIGWIKTFNGPDFGGFLFSSLKVRARLDKEKPDCRSSDSYFLCLADMTLLIPLL